MHCTDTVADTICRTVELGVTITGAAADSKDRTHIWCSVIDPDPRCPECHIAGQLRDHAERILTDTPAAGHPVELHVAVPRFECLTSGCPRSIFRADITGIASPRSVVTTRTERWILQRIAIDKMSVAAVAANLGIAWKTVNQIAVDAARSMVYDGGYLDGVRHLGVDEHKVRHEALLFPDGGERP
nr:helix-turn-helix domain-containing protein [Tomitella gaofuii]